MRPTYCPRFNGVERKPAASGHVSGVPTTVDDMSANLTRLVLTDLRTGGRWDFGGFTYGLEPLTRPPAQTLDDAPDDRVAPGHRAVCRRIQTITECGVPPAFRRGLRGRGVPVPVPLDHRSPGQLRVVAAPRPAPELPLPQPALAGIRGGAGPRLHHRMLRDAAVHRILPAERLRQRDPAQRAPAPSGVQRQLGTGLPAGPGPVPFAPVRVRPFGPGGPRAAAEG